MAGEDRQNWTASLASLPKTSNVSYSNDTLGLTYEDTWGRENASISSGVHLQRGYFGNSIGLGIPNTALAVVTVNYCFAMVLLIISLVGCMGNSLVLYVLARYSKLRGYDKPLVLSLTLGDLINSALIMLPMISSLNQSWVFGHIGCSVYSAIERTCQITSLLSMSAIAANRFSVIIGSPRPGLLSKKVGVIIWLAGGCILSPPVLLWTKNYSHVEFGPICLWNYSVENFWNRLYNILMFTLGFTFPLATIMISYVGILWVVCNRSVQFKRVYRVDSQPISLGQRATDVKTRKIILSVLLGLLTAWMPHAVVTLVGLSGSPSSRVPLVGQMLSTIFTKTSVIFNPVMHCFSHPRFNIVLRHLIYRHPHRKYEIKRYPLGFQDNNANRYTMSSILTYTGTLYQSCINSFNLQTHLLLFERKLIEDNVVHLSVINKDPQKYRNHYTFTSIVAAPKYPSVRRSSSFRIEREKNPASLHKLLWQSESCLTNLIISRQVWAGAKSLSEDQFFTGANGASNSKGSYALAVTPMA